MKFKKIMLITLVLLAILMIGAVSASDDTFFNETLTVDNAEEVSADVSLDENEVSDDGDVIAASESDYVISDGNSTTGGDDIVPFFDGNSTKMNPGMRVNVENAVYGKPVDIEITFDNVDNGIVTASVDGMNYTVNFIDGCGQLSLNNLNIGTHMLNVVYEGDDNYCAAELTMQFSVLPGENSTGNGSGFDSDELNFIDMYLCLNQVINTESGFEGVNVMGVTISGIGNKQNAVMSITSDNYAFTKDLSQHFDYEVYNDDLGGTQYGINFADVDFFNSLENEANIIFEFTYNDEVLASETCTLSRNGNTIRIFKGDSSDNPENYVEYDGLSVYIMDVNLDDPYSVVKVSEWPEGIADDINITLQKDGEEAIVTSWNLNDVDRDGAGYAMWNVEQLQIQDEGRYLISFGLTVDGTDKVIETGYVNIGFNGDDGNINLWVNTEDTFSTVTEDLPTIFACVRVPEGTEGNVTFICDKGILYNLALSDFMDGRIDRENNIYNIALEVDGEFIFEGLDDGDWFKFAFIDDNGDEITSRDYHIFFGENTVRFEVDAHNPGDHVSIDVNGEININDDYDFVWINLPSDVTEGKVMVTSGEFTLFEESVNFDDGTHWWREIDDHYVCSFSPASLTNWDKLNTGDVVTFAFLDVEDQMVESKDYKVTVEDDNVCFEESIYIDAGIWNSDEMGTLYTDTYYTDIVWVNVPGDVYGTVSVMVNGEERDSWVVEYDEDEWAHHEWGLMDLGIFDEGDYNVTVKHNDEILCEAMLHVVNDNHDRFRTVYIADRLRLFCPENATGKVRITFEGQDDEGNYYPVADDFIYEISPKDSGIWIELTADDLGIELDYYYYVTVNVEDDDGEVIYNESRWYEFAIYWQESRIWYWGNNEIINYPDSQWASHNYIRLYYEHGSNGTVSFYINNYDWSAEPDYVFDYSDMPTGYYYISLNDIGINDVGEYYLIAEYQWGEDYDGCDPNIAVYEPQIASGVTYHNDAGDHVLTIEIFPVRTIITGDVWDDYVVELRGEYEDYNGQGSTIFINFGNGTVVQFDADEAAQCGGKIGSKLLRINKEGEYNITVTCRSNTSLTEVSCSGTIRYLSRVKAELNMYNMRSDKLYVGYGLDGNEYITFNHRDGGYCLNKTEGNVSVYINGKLDKTFNIKSLPTKGEFDDMYYFIPISELSEIPIGNNTITVIYEGNEAAVEKSQNFTAVLLTAEKFFEYATIDIKENVYGDHVTPVKICFSGNPMSADPLIWGKLILYVNGEKIDKTLVVFHEGIGNPGDLYGIYDVTDPEAIELMDKVHRNELEGWYYDEFNWLNLAYMGWYNEGMIYLSLDDLNITSEGIYNITLNYFGYDDASDKDAGYDGYGSELRIFSQNINYTIDDTHMKVVITPENKYSFNTPSLINFEIGNDYWNPSTDRTYNNVVVYINDTLAFNDTLVRYTYGDWDAQIKIFGGASSNCLSRDILNEFDCVDEGTYHARVYLENDDKTLTEIAEGDFAVIKQRGNMSFRIDTSVDLGEHTYLYVDIPEGVLNYAYLMRIVTDDDEIEFDTGSIESKLIGQGEVPIDLGILRKGLHVVYVELAPDAYYYDVSKNFYSNHFKLQVIGTNSTVTPETFYDFFDEKGVLTSDADDLIFEGEFSNVTMTINRPVSLIGSDATFNDVSIIVESDYVSIENLNLIYTASGDADAYAVLVNGVSNFGMVNNTITYTGKTDGNCINNAVRITDSSSVAIRNNAFMLSLVSAYVPWVEEPEGSDNWVSQAVSEGIVVSYSRDIDFEDNVVVINYNDVSGSYDTIYGVSFRNSDNARITGNIISAMGHNYIYALYVCGNEFGIYDNEITAESDINYACAINVEGPGYGLIEYNNIHAKAPSSAYAVYSNNNEVTVSYVSNTITAEGFFIFGIYDDSEEIIDNTITLTGNYTVGIVVLSEAVVENNKISLIASNVGNESIWDLVPMETSGIVVYANASILNNEISSNNKAISLLGGSSTITGNVLTGYVYVESNTNTFTRNMINATSDYAIDLGNSTGNVITENELYANELKGDFAVNGDVSANEIYDNYPFNKTDAVLAVEASDINEGENQIIEVTLPADATGQVTLSVAGMNYTSDVIEGKAVFNIPALNVGTYTVIATYSGDEKYAEAQANTTFAVAEPSKEFPEIYFDVAIITYPDDLVINMTAPGDATGTLYVSLMGNTYPVQFMNGKAFLNIPGLDAGTYSIFAVYSGDEIYNNYSYELNATVLRADSSISMENTVFDYAEEIEVNFTMTGAVDFKAVVFGDGEDAYVSFEEVMYLRDFTAGTHTIQFTTVPDENHNAVVVNVTVTINRLPSSISIESVVVDYTDKFNVSFSVTGAEDITPVIVNAPEADIIWDMEENVITVIGLNAGSYILNVVTVPDVNHEATEVNVTITVNKVNSTLTVSDAVSEYDQAAIVPVVYDGATGVSASVADYPDAVITYLSDAISIPGLAAGNYTLNVETVPDGNHLAVVKTARITVNKVASAVILGDIIFNYGESGICYINVTGATGVNAVVVDHDEAIVTADDNVITVSNLSAGLYTLKVTTIPDENHATFETIVNITVNRVDSSISMEKTVFDYASEIEVNFTMTGAVDFEAVVFGDGGDAYVSFEEVMYLRDFTAGTHTIQFTTVPDENHNAVVVNVTVTINRLPSSISIESVVVDYTDKFNVSFSVTGAEDITPVIVEAPEADIIWDMEENVITVTGLNAGSYILNVVTVPDANHEAAEANVTIVVNKVDSTLTVSDAVVRYGETAVVPVSAQGADSINATLLGYPDAVINYLSDGITISGLAAGNYTLKVITVPDANHNAAEATANIAVNRVIVTNDNFNEYFNENGELIHDLPELIFTGEFADKHFNINKSVNLVGEGAEFTNVQFTVRSDNVSIINMELNYTGANPIIDVDGVSNFTLDNSFIVYSTGADWASVISVKNSDEVIIKDNYIEASGKSFIDGILISDSNFTIKSNTISVSSGMVAEGINIVGSGNGNVRGNKVDVIANRTVYGMNTTVIYQLNIIFVFNIIYGEAIFAVGINDDSETIDNNKVTLKAVQAIGVIVNSENAEITNNEIKLVSADPSQQDHGIESSATGVQVNAKSTISYNEIDSFDKSISVDGGCATTISNNNMNAPITVSTEGTSILGNDISTDKDKAIVLLDSASNTNVDSNVLAANGAKGNDAVSDEGTGNTISNNKAKPELNIEAISDIFEGQSVVIVIKAENNFTGTVNVQVGTFNTTTSVVNGRGKADVAADKLAVGDVVVKVIFAGNEKYVNDTVNTTFTVKAKIATAIKATAVTTTYGTSKNIVITLTDANGNVLVGKQVTVVLNGVSKTLTTDAKGQATYAIGTKLAVKKYDATVTFAGDDGYVKSTGTAKVTVNKAKSVLTAKKKTFKVKKAKKYSITLKSGKVAIKKVKVTLTGKFKGKKIKIIVKTNAKGKATFNLKKLTKKGKFTATIKFAGNKYYNAVTKKVKLTVK